MTLLWLCETHTLKRCLVCTGLIKSDRPLYLSVSHEKGNRLSNLKILKRIIDVSLTEFQIRTVSRVATMSCELTHYSSCKFLFASWWLNRVISLAVSFTTCQLACFYQYNLCYIELQTFHENNILHMPAKPEPHTTIGSTVSFKNNHTYPRLLLRTNHWMTS